MNLTPLLQRNNDIIILGKYLISGGSGAIIQIFVTTTLVKYLNVHYVLAAITGYCIALLTTFTLQRFWTFGGKEKHHAIGTMWLYYIVISLSCLLLNTLLLYIFIDKFNRDILLSDTIAVGFVSLISFILNKKITFKNSYKIS